MSIEFSLADLSVLCSAVETALDVMEEDRAVDGNVDDFAEELELLLLKMRARLNR